MIEQGIYFLGREPYGEQHDGLYTTWIYESEKAIYARCYDEMSFSVFNELSNDEELVRGRDVYCANDKNTHITLFDSHTSSSTTRYRPYSELRAYRYAIETRTREKSVHLTSCAKLKKAYYYNNAIAAVLHNNNTIRRREYPQKATISVETLPSVKRKLGRFYFDREKCHVTVNMVFGNAWRKNRNDVLTIEPITCLELSFERGLTIEGVHRLADRIDACFYLLTYRKCQFERLGVVDYRGNSFKYADLRNSSTEVPHGIRIKENYVDALSKLLDYILAVDEFGDNGLSTFIRFTDTPSYLEVAFTEYYRTLEFVYRRKTNNYKTDKILPTYIKRYNDIFRRIYPNDNPMVIENELKNLRNFFVHYGYFVKKLPIPTRKIHNPDRWVDVDINYIARASKLVKVFAFLSIYESAGIEFDQNEMFNQII